jgi:hypothetical protein
MGDGVNYKGYGVSLATDSYSSSASGEGKIKDTVRLMNVLIIRYNLKCSLHPRKEGQHRIYISSKSMGLLRTIVEAHMDRGMLYKINL